MICFKHAPCQVIQYSLEFWIPHCRFRIPGTEFQIPCQQNLYSGFQSLAGFWISWAGLRILKPRIPDCGFHKQIFPVIADSTSKNLPESGFLKQKFHGFWILQAKISWILDSTSKNFPDSEFHQQRFPGFWIRQAKIFRILNSRSKNFPDSGFHKQKFPGFWNPDYLTWGDIKIWLVFSFAFSFCPREIDDPSEKVAYLVEDSRKSSVPVRSDHTDSKGPTSVWEWNWNARTNGPETLVHRIIV